MVRRAPRLDQRALHRAERAESSRHGHLLVSRNDVAPFILVVSELKATVIAESSRHLGELKASTALPAIIDKPFD